MKDEIKHLKTKINELECIIKDKKYIENSSNFDIIILYSDPLNDTK